MAFDVTTFITPAAVAVNWTETASNRENYLGAGLFPSKKKAGLDLAWIKGNRGLPISLKPSAFDAKATFRDRVGVNRLEAKMPFFREGYKINEVDRQEMFRATDANDPYAAAIIDRIFDDTTDLIAGAEVASERMRMQLLFPDEGAAGISIKANGVNYTYNYDPDGDWKKNNYTALTGTDLWTAADTADPFKVFQNVKNKASAQTGTNLTRVVMNGYTFDLMVQMASVKNRYLTASGTSFGYLTNQEVRNVIEATSGVRIAVYDKQYRDEDGVSHKFVPDGYISVLPEGNLGSTWYGTTPEEADLMINPAAQVSIVNTGVAITKYVNPHPVETNIIASEIVLPSFERMDEVHSIKVI